MILGAPITSPSAVTVGDAKMSTTTIWDANYDMTAGLLSGPYKNATGASTGKLVLDDSVFDFGSKYSTDYLVSISLTSALPKNASTNNLERLALSAISVSQTPEPSTIALLGAGFGLFGMSRFRRRKA